MRIMRIFITALFAIILIACSQQEEDGYSSASPDYEEIIRIAVAGPHTGAYAASGEQLWRGATQAVADINAGGGINGVMVEAIKGDDACDPDKAVTLANKLLKEYWVTAVVGHFCSGASIPASEVYNEADVLMISPASTNPRVTDRRLNNVLRVSGRDDDQSIVAGEYMSGELTAERVAIVHDSDLYGKGLADATRNQLDRAGVDVVLYEAITRGNFDLGELVAKISAANPDVVYFGGLHKEAGHLLRQIREQNIDAWFISGAGIASDEFVKATGDNRFLRKTLMTFGADPRDEKHNPDGIEVVQRFRQQGYEPEGYTLYAYTATQVVAAALQANQGEKSGKVLAEWIKANGVPTATGMKRFDDKGDLRVSDYVIYRWTTDGTYERI